MVGPDLEPLESESRRGAHPPDARHGSLTVAGAGSELVVKLTRAEENTGGWCELEQVLPDDRRRTVYVNARAVRSVVDEDESRAYEWRCTQNPEGQ
jgi:hypothetical protein